MNNNLKSIRVQFLQTVTPEQMEISKMNILPFKGEIVPINKFQYKNLKCRGIKISIV